MVRWRTGRWWLRYGANNTTPMNSNHNIELVLALYIHCMMLPVHDSAKYRFMKHHNTHNKAWLSSTCCRPIPIAHPITQNSSLCGANRGLGSRIWRIYIICIVGCWIADITCCWRRIQRRRVRWDKNIIIVVIAIAIIITKCRHAERNTLSSQIGIVK